MRKLLLLSFFMISSFSIANATLNPATYVFAVEWLYMLDSIDRPFYSFDSSGGTVGTEHALEQTWHSGYRLEASRRFCATPSELLVRWTHFPEFSNHTSVDGVQNIELGGGDTVSTSSNHTKFNFYKLEVLYNYYICQNPCFYMKLESGLQYAQIRFKERVEGSGVNTLLVKDRSKRCAIGPDVGLEVNYALWRCLSLETRAEASLLAARKKSHAFENVNGTIDVDIEADRYWIVVPTFDLRLGLKYNHCINNCLDLSLEAGYEFMTFLKGMDRYFAFDDAVFYMDFSLHGPFVRLAVAF